MARSTWSSYGSQFAPVAEDDATALPVDHPDVLRLLTSHDGAALIRLIAGDIAGLGGPGVTHTPITYPMPSWLLMLSSRSRGTQHIPHGPTC